jgi:membrane associated rhomboid family serine protease
MQNAAHTIREELLGIVTFLGIIWAVFLVSLVFPSLDNFGVVPRTLWGLAGIPAMPFLHANLGHILSNTVPLFFLLVLLAGSKARSGEIVVDVILLGGFLLWLCGRSHDHGRSVDHIGASGLIFGLISFLICSGILEKRLVPLAVAILVGFAYGGTLLTGVLPTVGPQVSWDGHLCGAVAGGIVAYGLTKEPKQRAS